MYRTLYRQPRFLTSSLGATGNTRELPDRERGEGGGRGTEEDKSVGYPERHLSLLRGMKSIRDQAESKETAAEVDDEGRGGGGGVRLGWERWREHPRIRRRRGRDGSGTGNKGGSEKDSSYDDGARESTPSTVSPHLEYYALVIEAWARNQRWNLGGGSGGGG